MVRRALTRARTYGATSIAPSAMARDESAWQDGMTLATQPAKATELESGQTLGRVAECGQCDAHAVHQRQVQAAQPPLLGGLLVVVEDPPRGERAPEVAECEDRDARAVVAAAGPHVRHEQQARVVEHRALALRHRLQPAGEVRELPGVVAVHEGELIGLVLVRQQVVSFAHGEERVEHPGDVAARQQLGAGRFVVWKASARMSAIRRMCSRMSSGSPFSGRLMTSGSPWRAAWPACSAARRTLSMRRSSSRTLVKYSSSFARSETLAFVLRSAACAITRSRMLRLRSEPRFSNSESNASDGYTSIGTGDVGLVHEMWEPYAIEKFVS